MPQDPTRKLSPTEVMVYGADAKISPLTGEVYEQGTGCLPPALQESLVHVLEIERREGKAAADEVRRKLRMATRPLANK
jgi:hypothetical protein